jgi:organic hydroperoxide reductase OsmC/OhrA
VWVFEGGAQVSASAAPAYRGDPAKVHPEDALVAALSSCHTLTFWAMTAKKRLVVERYSDQAVGVLEQNGKGRLAMTRVTLHPQVVLGGQNRPTPEQLRKLHEEAHGQCFIASSVTTAVTVAIA